MSQIDSWHILDKILLLQKWNACLNLKKQPLLWFRRSEFCLLCLNPHPAFSHLFYGWINISGTPVAMVVAVFAQARINITHDFIACFEVGRHADAGTNLMWHVQMTAIVTHRINWKNLLHFLFVPKSLIFFPHCWWVCGGVHLCHF